MIRISGNEGMFGQKNTKKFLLDLWIPRSLVISVSVVLQKSDF